MTEGIFRVLIVALVLIECLPHSLLFLSDSLDRYASQAWCNFAEKESRSHSDQLTGNLSTVHNISFRESALPGVEVDWGNESIKYGLKYDFHSPSFCKNKAGDTVSAMHLYGSSKNGPYFITSFEIPTPPYINRSTDYRIKVGLNDYIEQFGTPQKIVLQTINWDNMAVNEGKLTIDEYPKNTEYLLRYIKSMLGEQKSFTEVALRTAPIGKHLDHFFDLNRKLRELAVEQKVTFFDWNNDLWSLLDFEINQDNSEILFRDGAHPKEYYSLLGAEKQLGTLYSRFNIRNGHIPPRNHVVTSLSPEYDNVKIRLMQVLVNEHSFTSSSSDANTYSASNGTANDSNLHLLEEPQKYLRFSEAERHLFYIREVGGKRFRLSNVSNSALRMLNFGVGDIMTVSRQVIESIPLRGAMPTMLDGERVGVLTKTKRTYIVFEGGLVVEGTNSSVLNVFRKTLAHVFLDIDDFWFEHMHSIAILPDIYKDRMLVQFHKDKQVYIVLGGMKRPINSVNVFFAYGWDFDQVQKVIDMRYLDVLETGPEFTEF
jgi:hypothetical protein